MFYFVLFFLLSVIPIIWINYIFTKNDKILPNMPFDGYEFGEKLIKEFKLERVCLEKTSVGDHYDPVERKVRVHENRLNRKSLTSISIICHEIGHAIQHEQGYTPLMIRTKLVKNTQWINKLSTSIIYFVFPVILTTGFLPLIKICFSVILLCLLIGVIIHLVTLEVELDASFNKAYPIIKKKIPKVYHNSCHSILKAAAFTYLVGVFKNLLSLRMILSLITRFR